MQHKNFSSPPKSYNKNDNYSKKKNQNSPVKVRASSKDTADFSLLSPSPFSLIVLIPLLVSISKWSAHGHIAWTPSDFWHIYFHRYLVLLFRGLIFCLCRVVRDEPSYERVGQTIRFRRKFCTNCVIVLIVTWSFRGCLCEFGITVLLYWCAKMSLVYMYLWDRFPVRFWDLSLCFYLNRFWQQMNIRWFFFWLKLYIGNRDENDRFVHTMYLQ